MTVQSKTRMTVNFCRNHLILVHCTIYIDHVLVKLWKKIDGHAFYWFLAHSFKCKGRNIFKHVASRMLYGDLTTTTGLNLISTGSKIVSLNIILRCTIFLFFIEKGVKRAAKFVSIKVRTGTFSVLLVASVIAFKFESRKIWKLGHLSRIWEQTEQQKNR